MSFPVILQKNASEDISLDKELTTISALSGNLKDESSLIDPIIQFSGDITRYISANYMTIAAFGRSYFITDIRVIRRNIFEISGHCDVLSTYKDQIRQNKAIIKRQESKYNLYLNDGSLKAYQNPIVVTKKFPSGFTTQEFVLAVAGG